MPSAPSEFLPNHSCFELGKLERWQVCEARQVVCSWEFANMQMPVWFRKEVCSQRCGRAAACRGTLSRVVCTENMGTCGICQLLSRCKWHHQSHTLCLAVGS